MKRQSGVALILVLMVTGVLGLLMLQFALTAREHTARAQRLVERTKADMLMHSVRAETMFTLLTVPWDEPAEALPAGWNYGGRPFNLRGAEVRVQDFNGLVTLPQPGESLGEFSAMLRTLNIPDDRVRRAVDVLAKSIAPPASAPVQDFYELMLITDLSAVEIARLRETTTLYPARVFNPSTATPGALAVRYSGTMLQGLQTLREQGALDAASFFSVTGQGTDEVVAFYPGPGFRITTRVSLGDFAAAEELSVKVEPYAADPFEVWSRRRPPPAVQEQ